MGGGTAKTLHKSRRGDLGTGVPHTSPVDLISVLASQAEPVLESQKMVATVVPT